MVIVMNRIPVAQGREREFEETFAGRDRAVDQMPGFVEMQVWRPTEGRIYIVMTRWQSREDFQRWTESEAFMSAHRKSTPVPAENRPTLEIYEVFIQ